jgi:hypothetical protein
MEANSAGPHEGRRACAVDQRAFVVRENFRDRRQRGKKGLNQGEGLDLFFDEGCSR